MFFTYTTANSVQFHYKRADLAVLISWCCRDIFWKGLVEGHGSSSFKPHNLSYTLEPSFVRTVDPIRMLVFSLAPSSVKLTMAGIA